MTRRAALFAIALVFGAASAHADAARTAGLTLQRTTGARPAGMGEAFAGLADDANAYAYNPAGYGTLPDSQAMATYLRGIVKDQFGFLGYAHALPWGAVFAGASYFDAGTIDLNLSNGLQDTRRAQQDVVAMVGAGVGRNGPLSAGVLVKGFRFELAEEATASGVAADAGLLWRTPLRGLSFGAAVQNAGPDIRYEAEDEPIPLTGRAGAAWSIDFDRFNRLRSVPYTLILAADAVSVRRDDTAARAGLELRRTVESPLGDGHAALRGGYAADREAITIGAGALMGTFSLDYAINLFDDLDPAHRVTIGWVFRRPDGELERSRRNVLGE